MLIESGLERCLNTSIFNIIVVVGIQNFLTFWLWSIALKPYTCTVKMSSSAWMSRENKKTSYSF